MDFCNEISNEPLVKFNQNFNEIHSTFDKYKFSMWYQASQEYFIKFQKFQLISMKFPGILKIYETLLLKFHDFEIVRIFRTLGWRLQWMDVLGALRRSDGWGREEGLHWVH